MADREIHVPFGPDRTNGAGIDPVSAETGAAEPTRDPFAEPTPAAIAALEADDPFPTPLVDEAKAPIVEPMAMASDSEGDAGGYQVGGMSDEEATAQGMDAMQMSILALKDSIGQSRELKARERDREELAQALAADHEELADRENILANYQALVDEQDAIIADSTRRRDEQKAELAQVAASMEEDEEKLARMREKHAEQLQPLEAELGRERASAEQARNDERSRKGELNAAEKELSRADDSDANAIAVAKHQRARTAYDEARKRSAQAKEQLAQVQRAYDDAHRQADEAASPLERKIKGSQARTEELKDSMNRLGDAISAARKRRQYCDNVFQYPEETAKMRREVEVAEATARQMDEENDLLREKLAASKKRARKAKAAIVVVIVLVIVIIAAFVVVSGR